MAAIVNIPFNFQPVTSPSRKTASYTVPANRYAKAILSFYQHRTASITTYNGSTSFTVGWITINGVNVLQERVIGVNFLFNSPSGGPFSPIINFSGFSGLFQGFFQNLARITSNGSIIINNSNGQVIANPAYMNFGVINSLQAGSLATSTTDACLIGTITNFQNPEFIEVWLKPGDVINATAGNWQAVVTEYAIPS